MHNNYYILLHDRDLRNINILHSTKVLKNSIRNEKMYNKY